jgi:hypothetical protein
MINKNINATAHSVGNPNKNRVFILMVLGFVLFMMLSSCTASYNNMVVEDRVKNYDGHLDYFRELEHEYLTLLANLERYPKDQFLLGKKAQLIKELDQQRLVLSQSRVELDQAIRDWEVNIMQERTQSESVKEVLDRAKDGRVKDRPEWEGFE